MLVLRCASGDLAAQDPRRLPTLTSSTNQTIPHSQSGPHHLFCSMGGTSQSTLSMPCTAVLSLLRKLASCSLSFASLSFSRKSMSPSHASAMFLSVALTASCMQHSYCWHNFKLLNQNHVLAHIFCQGVQTISMFLKENLRLQQLDTLDHVHRTNVFCPVQCIDSSATGHGGLPSLCHCLHCHTEDRPGPVHQWLLRCSLWGGTLQGALLLWSSRPENLWSQRR